MEYIIGLLKIKGNCQCQIPIEKKLCHRMFASILYSISRDESASATYVLKEKEGDDRMTEEWIQFHRLQSTYNEFEFRNSQVCLV